MNTLSVALARGPLEVFAPAKPDSLPTRRSLLGRMQDLGDSESWRAFFKTYWQLIYNLARKSGLSDDQAQDVVQETVIAVARQMPKFRYDPAKGSFKQWLRLICRRKIQDHLRRVYSSRQLSSDDLVAEELPALPADADMDGDWDQEWRANIFQMALARVRQQINPKQYQAFDYCVLQDMRAGVVASKLGLNTAQVYLAKHRVSAAVKHAAKTIEATLARTRSAG